MRQVQEMAVEFVNALNAAAAAESECSKLRRLVEEERKLVQRLKQEKEDEAQMAKRKIERMSQRLAEAQKDVEYATARADVAENEWVKLKRELREAQELVQLLNPESEETRQIVLRQGDDKELELANALNAASVAESECDKLRTLLEEERKLVQRFIVENEDEAQVAKRQIEEIGQELADARKNAEYATARADNAETEWIKAKKELQKEKELSQLLKPECDEIRQSTMRQVEEKERELINALHASEIAERKCAELKSLLEEEKKLVQRLILEKGDEVQLARRQIEEIDQELAHTRKDAELARKDADAAESECANLKRRLIEEGKTVQRLIIEKDDEAEQAKGEIEKMGRELAYARKEAQYARNHADIAENEWTKVKREVKEKEELIKLLKLEIQEMRQITERQVEEVNQELEEARNEAGHAQNDADIAQNEWTKVKREVKEKEDLIKLLKLEIQEIRQITMREVEELSQELEDARKEAEHAQNDADLAQNEWTKVKREVKEKEELIKLLKLEIQEMRQITERQVEELSQELEDARKAAEHAQNDADIAQNEWTKVKREVKEKKELIKLLKLDIQEMRQITERQVEEISQKLEEARNEAEHAQNDADIAQNEWIKAKKDVQEKLELIKMLKLECQETSERAMRLVEEKELELADALNAVTSASSSSSVAQECAICLTNEKDMAFGCGHMTCEECGMMLPTCPICREDITIRIKLFPG